MTRCNKKNGTNPRQNMQESLTVFMKKEDKRVSKVGTKVLFQVKRRHRKLRADDGVGKEKWVSGGEQRE